MTIIKRFVTPDDRLYFNTLRFFINNTDNTAYDRTRCKRVFTKGILYLQHNVPVACCIWHHSDEFHFDLTYSAEFYIIKMWTSPTVSRDVILHDVYKYCQVYGIRYLRVNIEDEEFRDYYQPLGFRNMGIILPHQVWNRVITTVAYTPVDGDYEDDDYYVDDDDDYYYGKLKRRRSI
jgi:hypothetical protein